MANKPQGKSWSEIQMAITAVAITATLAFWNLFATPDKAEAVAQVEEAFTPPPPPLPTETAEPTATVAAVPTTQSLGLVPIKIIYGGTIPTNQQQPIVVAQAPQLNNNKKNNNNKPVPKPKAPAPKPPKKPSTGKS